MTTAETVENNPLELSDEEFSKKNWDEFLASNATQEVLDTSESENQETDTTNEELDNTVSDDKNLEKNKEEEEEKEKEEEEEEEKKEEDTSEKVKFLDSSTKDESSEEATMEPSKGEIVDSEDDEEGGEESKNKENIQKIEDEEIDYKQAYYDLIEPFKANGRMMQVENISDARKLMQMGANYNKKMTALKPYLQLIKTLQKNKITEKDDINYLIDIHKKDPKAIQQLIKDSGIDPLEIDKDKDPEYVKKDYIVSEQEINIDTVLDSIKDTVSYTKTLDIINNIWDDSTQKHFINNPHLIAHLNTQVENGIFDRVMNIVEREKALGHISGLNDIQAYEQIGEQLFTQGKLNDLLTPMNNTNTNKSTSTKTVKKTDPKLKDKKRAASSTKSSSKGITSSTKDFNPLNMPDEEFEKLVLKDFI